MSMAVDADDTEVLLINSLVNVASLGYEGGKLLKKWGSISRGPALSSYQRIRKRLF